MILGPNYNPEAKLIESVYIRREEYMNIVLRPKADDGKVAPKEARVVETG